MADTFVVPVFYEVGGETEQVAAKGVINSQGTLFLDMGENIITQAFGRQLLNGGLVGISVFMIEAQEGGHTIIEGENDGS